MSDKPRTDPLEVVGTPNNPNYSGASGNVRNSFTKRHAGIDEDAMTSRFTGKYAGKVLRAIPLKDSPRYGGFVEIEFRTPDGIRYSQTTMHLEHLNVRKGQQLQPGDIIGTGQGKGTQFSSGETPHVHSEFRREDRLIEPYSGKELDYNPYAEVRERERLARNAADLARIAKESKNILEFHAGRSPTAHGFVTLGQQNEDGSVSSYAVAGCLQNGAPISQLQRQTAGR